jgi:hypothetical protein
MSLSSLSSTQLHRLIELVKEKESLQSKLAKVESAMAAFDGNGSTAKTAGNKRGPRRKLKRGALKDGVLGKLKEAGKEGLTVKELAASLNANHASLSVWFYTTGKKVKGIKKVGIARYAYTGE